MVYLSLGSNMGDRLSFLLTAATLLREEVFDGRLKYSAVFETPPWGNTNQQPFFNMVVGGNSTFEPAIILKKVLEIEQSLGRQRSEKWGPRTIDIDILLIDNQIINLDHLQVPHPYLHERLFVLKPLVGLAPDLVHPVKGKSISALISSCPAEEFRQVLSGLEFEKLL